MKLIFAANGFLYIIEEALSFPDISRLLVSSFIEIFLCPNLSGFVSAIIFTIPFVDLILFFVIDNINL